MVVRKTGERSDHHLSPVWYYPNAAMMKMKYRYNKQKMPSIPKNSPIAFMVRLVWYLMPSPLFITQPLVYLIYTIIIPYRLMSTIKSNNIHLSIIFSCSLFAPHHFRPYKHTHHVQTIHPSAICAVVISNNINALH